MENEFDKLMDSLLDSYDANKEKNVDAFIEEKVKELDLSKEDEALLKETNDWIECFDKNSKDLQDAKAAGKSRQSWMTSKMNSILSGCSEKEKTEVVNAILSANEEVINGKLTEE